MSGEAEQLLNSKLLNEIFDGMEANAIELSVNAKPSDDEMRRTSNAEVRAIRQVRGQLTSLLRDKTKPSRGSVA